MEKQYKYYRCVLDGKEFLSRANRPQCPQCSRHKVNIIEKPSVMVDQAAAKVDAIADNKSEVADMPKEKEPKEPKEPVADEDEEDDGFF